MITKPTNVGNSRWFIGLSLLLAVIAIVVFLTGKNLPDFLNKPTPIPESLNGLQPNLYSEINGSSYGSSSAWPTTGYVEPGFYSFDYWLDPSGKYAKVTLNYEYPTPIDITEFRYIEFTIDFIEPNNPCYFYIESDVVPKGKPPIILKNGKKPSWFYGLQINSIPLNDSVVKPLGEEKYLFQIPLIYYSDINLKQTRKIGFYIDTYIAHDEHRISVGNIHLVQ